MIGRYLTKVMNYQENKTELKGKCKMTNKTAIEFKFDLFGDYKKQFAGYTKELYSTGLELPVEERKALIEALTSAYINATGERPEGKELEKLGNWLLLDYLADSRSNKRRDEAPVLSKNQVLSRKMKERRLFENM